MKRVNANNKIRVLYLLNSHDIICGVSRHFAVFIKELKNNKSIEVFVICGGGDKTSELKTLDIQFEINKKFMHKKRTVIGFISSVVYLLKYCIKNKIDLIHSHHHYAGNIAQIVSKLLNIPTILTNHGILPNIGKLTHFPSDEIIVVNKHAKDYLLSINKMAERKIHIIHSGLKPYNKAKELNKRIKFIVASRIVYDKGVDLYLKAISLLSDEYKSKAEFYLAGDGDYLSKIMVLNNELKTEIIYLGIIEDMQKYFCETDVFVLPTRSKSEGFPTSLIQACLQKNLIISSNFWGLTDIFEPMKDGLVFESDNYIELSEVMRYVIDNYSELQFMVDNFYKKSEKMFDPQIMVKKTVSIYERLLNK